VRVIGQENIASMMGVAPKTIVEWQEQGLPIALRGSPGIPSEYESADVIRWYVERELKKVREESPNDRLARVKADAIEMDNAERRGLLIPADQIEPKLRAAMVLAREAWMDAVPQAVRKARAAADDEAAEAVLEAEFAQFLARISRWRDADSIDEED
jgi:phage terminase Nu1 subunit (DNA packaging protein)